MNHSSLRKTKTVLSCKTFCLDQELFLTKTVSSSSGYQDLVTELSTEVGQASVQAEELVELAISCFAESEVRAVPLTFSSFFWRQ